MLQILMEVGRLEKKTAHSIVGSMLEILSAVRIRSMSQSATERLHALVLMVLSVRYQIPEVDRQNLLKYIVDEIGPQLDDRKAFLEAQCLYVAGLPKPWFSGKWVTGRWGNILGPSSGSPARGIKRGVYAL